MQIAKQIAYNPRENRNSINSQLGHFVTTDFLNDLHDRVDSFNASKFNKLYNKLEGLVRSRINS